MSEDALRPVITSCPPRYRLAMWLVILEIILPTAAIYSFYGFVQSSREAMGLYISIASLIQMLLALYFTFVLVDISHRFDGYRRADAWLWIDAGLKVASTGTGVLLWHALPFLPSADVISDGVRSLFFVASVGVAIGVFVSLRGNQPRGLLGLCPEYRWLVLFLSISSVTALFQHGRPTSLLFVGFLAAALARSGHKLVLGLIFYRASRAISQESARE